MVDRRLTGKTEKITIFLILLAASAIALPIFFNHLSSIRDSAALSLTPQKFNSLIISADRVAVFFSTTGCPDCNRMSPLWQALSLKYSGLISFIEVEYSLITSKVFDTYDVSETPTFILFAGGANVSRHDGSFASPDKMNQFLQTALSFGTDHAMKSSAPGNEQIYLASESPSLLISIILGISAFASPCVLPMVPGYLAFLFAGGKKNKVRIGVASVSSLLFGAASVLLVGFIFVILGNAFWSLLLMGELLISFVLLALGLAELFDVSILSTAPKILNVSPGASKFVRSVSTYSLLFGFLSLSCSMPFFIGALLNTVAGVDVYSMAFRLVAFAAGFASPLAALTFAIGTGVRISASKLSKASRIMSKIGGASMIAASLLLLITL